MPGLYRYRDYALLTAIGLMVLTIGPAVVCASDPVPADQPQPSLMGADAPADSAVSRGSTVVLPVLGYTPDTGLLFGGSLLRFFYLDPPGQGVRPSVFSPLFIYSLKNQIMVSAGTDLNWGRGRHHAGIMPRYLKFPDQFYGIGRDTRAGDEEDYTPEELALDLMYERSVLSEFRLGIDYRIQRHRLKKVEPDGMLSTGEIIGTEAVTLSAPGIHLVWDNRDHTWAPRRGYWLQGGLDFYEQALGSDLTYTRANVDLRAYLPLGGRSTLAIQLAMASLNGEVPFFDLPSLGGYEGLRGYKGGRYRDQVRLLTRLEYRSGPFWGRLGAVAFAGIGDVSPDVSRLTFSRQLWVSGFGLRYVLVPAEQVNLRVDFGFGHGDSGFFLSLGEAF